MGYHKETYYNEDIPDIVTKVRISLVEYHGDLTIDGLITNDVINDVRNQSNDPATHDEIRARLVDQQAQQLQAILNFLGNEMNGDLTKDEFRRY